MAAPQSRALSPQNATALQGALSKFPNRPPAVETILNTINAHLNLNPAQPLILGSAQCTVLKGCGVLFRRNQGIDSFSLSPAFLTALSSSPLPAPPQPIQQIPKYFSGFNFKSVSLCAWNALKTSAWLMPLGIFASGLHATNFFASVGTAFAATVKAVGSFSLITSLAANPPIALGIFAAAAAAYAIIFTRLQKRSSAIQQALAAQNKKMVATPLSSAESAIANTLSFCASHWGKAASIVAAAYFFTHWASGTFTSALSATFGAALGTAATAASAITGIGWGIPAIMLLYNIAKLRYESASSTT